MMRITSPWIFRILFTAAAAVLLILGIRSGEAGVVFEKAIRVCLECIGLG